MKKISVLGAASVAVFGYNSAAWAQQLGPNYGRNMMCDEDWYGWFFGPMTMILFLAVLIVVVVLIVRWFEGAGHGGPVSTVMPPKKHSVDILKDRFARGEIDKEEFEAKRRILEE